MASVFTRRFNFVPSDDVLVEIESANIVDLTPPAPIAGVGTGTALLVGEFETGPFELTTEVSSAADLQATFGGFGYTYGSSVANFPSAVSRQADGGALEHWNGNGALALNGKQFARLLICRVDTSVGAVQFSRLAFVTGAAQPSYPLDTGSVLGLDIGAGEVDATFTGTPATVAGSGFGGTTGFSGGETLTLGYDAVTDFVVTFLVGDQSATDVASRINAYAGFTFADGSSGQIVLTAKLGGTDGQVRVVAGSTGVISTLGLTVANTAGTGNVGNISAVTFAEVKAIVEAGISGTLVEQDPEGRLRVSNVATPLTGTITVKEGTGPNSLGFVKDDTSSAASGVAGVIPAGSVVTDDGTNVLVTMQDVAVLAAVAGPYSVKVRYAVDDVSGGGTSPSTIVELTTVLGFGSFSVTNAQSIGAALSESQIDAQYAIALATGSSTTSVSSIAKVTNVIWSARHSNAVRRSLRTNAIYASANGCFGRVACISPPLNTKSSDAVGNAEPGVGALRDERVIYCYVGFNVFVPPIALRGTAGGAGFTASGNIDQTSDGWMASILSQLNPEENPGQDTPFTSAANGIETGANVQGFDMTDYVHFKSKGIAAARFDADAGEMIFQSGITSVDPVTAPALTTIARRRMDDFIGDSIAAFATRFGKKLMTRSRRIAFRKGISAFLNGLLSPTNPDAQRIGGYTVTDKGLNTQDSLSRGLYKIRVDVQTLPSFDSTAVFLTAGPDVSVTVSLPQ